MDCQKNKIKIGVLLPHLKIYGGVKRYLEIGNNCSEMGHEFIIYAKDSRFTNWFLFKGQIKEQDSLFRENIDVLFFSQIDDLPLVLKAESKRKIFYLINPKEKVRRLLKHKEIEIFANSSGIKEAMLKTFRINCFPAYGGINLSVFNYIPPVEKASSGDSFVVMVYGRISKPKKGTMQVVKACESLYRKGYNLKLLLFDSPTDSKAEKAIASFKAKVPYEFVLNHPVEKNAELYHKADVFVSAETSGGWSNTSAEAMACGTPVIATEVGTKDFVWHGETGILLNRGNKRQIMNALVLLMNDFELRKRLSYAGRARIERFDWTVLTQQILENLSTHLHDN